MMRTRAAFGIATAAVLVSTSAFASDTGKGETGGKGGLGPGNSTPAAQGPEDTGEVLSTGQYSRANPDVADRSHEKTKPWEIGVVFETHRTIRQDDLEGTGARKVFNEYGVFADYSLTESDRIGIRDYFEEDFIADDGKSGVRSTDVQATYTRTQKLPRDFLLFATLSLSAPTSYISQKMGLITAPGLSLNLTKRFGRYVNVGISAGGTFFVTKYREYEGGQPAPELSLRASVNAEVVMPFYEALSIGASAETGYSWIYGVSNGDPASTPNGAVADNQFSSQPIQQSYGGEIFVRYVLPNLGGLRSDLSVAFAQGDPSLGFSNTLHDGVGYTYLFYRENSEVYATMQVRY